MTDDLTTPLLAAIDETERIARTAQDSGDAWTADRSRSGKWQVLREVEDSTAIGYIATGRLEIDHIVRQDPHATLRHCAAHRKIVERYARLTASASEDPTSVVAAVAAATAKADLVDLAAGYDLITEPAP